MVSNTSRVSALWTLALAWLLGCGAPAKPSSAEPVPAVSIAAVSDDAPPPDDDDDDDIDGDDDDEDAPPEDGSHPGYVVKTGRADPADGKVQQARQEFTLGVRAYAAADYPGARRHLETAYGLVPRPEVLFNLVNVALKQGDRQGACAYYRELVGHKLDARLQQMVAKLQQPCGP